MTPRLRMRTLQFAQVTLYPADARAQELTARLPEARAIDRLTRDKDHSPRAITSDPLVDPDSPAKR